MAEIVKITKGQPFVVYVPLVILNGDGSKTPVDAASITDLQVRVLGACCAEYDVEYSTVDHYIVLHIPENFIPTEYAVTIKAILPDGRPFSLRNHRAFAIVNWDHQSNWRNYLVDDHIELREQQFIAGNGIIVPVEAITTDEIHSLFTNNE